MTQERKQTQRILEMKMGTLLQILSRLRRGHEQFYYNKWENIIELEGFQKNVIFQKLFKKK